MPFDLGNSGSKVALNDEFDSFEFHFVYIDIESVIDIHLAFLLNHLLPAANQPQHTLN